MPPSYRSDMPPSYNSYRGRTDRSPDLEDGDSEFYTPHNTNNRQYSDTIPLRGPSTSTLPLAGPPPAEARGNVQFVSPVAETGKQRQARNKWLTKPWFIWFVSLVQFIVFIVEIIKNAQFTGSPIEIKPSFNPLIGPSSYTLIHLGARFAPCMHTIASITNDSSLGWPCVNDTSSTPLNQCSLEELCGMGGFKTDLLPDQWWRFIAPIFLHAGILHILFNLLLQLRMGADMERSIGPLRLIPIYLASGIFGFVLGGNFAADGTASTGASGALFGVIALTLLDLCMEWKRYEKPGRALIFLLIEIAVSFGLGLLPGLDNFSHIGGFVMGLLLGLALLRTPSRFTDEYAQTSYAPMTKRRLPRLTNRSKGWWLWILVRVVGLVGSVVLMAVLINNFYDGGGHCSWCKYLSCVGSWCDDGVISTTTTGSS
ncbi:hypothetical protein YB2330_000519 [Saitoella coloradoensis]